ncbi:MAG: hypothetical protein HQK74_01085 [Desulfamplus sp.]|nr:hypothetical protein [Desulfamplus sp.]
MKTKIAKYMVTLQILLSFCAYESMAFNDSEATAYLWKLINEARLRPAKTVEAYRIDYQRAKDSLGDDGWILELEDGLPPLALNAKLTEMSSAHNQDMIGRQYYSYTSPEGISFNDRIVNSGYNPAITGESLGILSFYIYVDPLKAVEGIFENMLRDELNPDFGYPKNIFNKDFTEIGISFISTTFSLGKDSSGKDITLNAYLVTADFAKPVEPRTYILGNIYNIGENQPNNLVWSENWLPENSYAKDLLSYKGWKPEKANNSFILWVHNITEGWSVAVEHGHLGMYQVEIPPDMFYSIDLYSKIDEPQSENGYFQGDLLDRVVNIGLNVNKMVDFGINQ